MNLLVGPIRNQNSIQSRQELRHDGIQKNQTRSLEGKPKAVGEDGADLNDSRRGALLVRFVRIKNEFKIVWSKMRCLVGRNRLAGLLQSVLVCRFQSTPVLFSQCLFDFNSRFQMMHQISQSDWQPSVRASSPGSLQWRRSIKTR